MIGLDEKELEYMEKERLDKLVKRSEEVRRSQRTRRLIASILIMVSVFLVVVSWVILGFTYKYAIAGAIGSVLLGIGLYLLFTEPEFKPKATLIDEVQLAVTQYEGERLKEEIREAIGRHRDEPHLAARLESIISTKDGEELSKALRDLIKALRG